VTVKEEVFDQNNATIRIRRLMRRCFIFSAFSLNYYAKATTINIGVLQKKSNERQGETNQSHSGKTITPGT
jgi:hypothetical protein